MNDNNWFYFIKVSLVVSLIGIVLVATLAINRDKNLETESLITATNSNFIALVEHGHIGNYKYRILRDKRSGIEFLYYNTSMVVIPSSNRNILLFTQQPTINE